MSPVSTPTSGAASITRRSCATSAATPTPTCSPPRSATRSRSARSSRVTDLGSQSELGRSLRPRLHPQLRRPAAAELAEAGHRARPRRGDPGQRPDPRRPLRGRAAHRPSGSASSGEIRENLGQLYERWDGHGMPRGLKGADVRLPVRLVTLAQDAIALYEAHGFEAMTEDDRPSAAAAPTSRSSPTSSSPMPNGCSPGSTQPVDRETILALEPAPHAYARRGGLRGGLSSPSPT